jgi:hypothetical protein
MSTENSELRRFTTRTDGQRYNFIVNTFQTFESDVSRLEMSEALSEQVINCYERTLVKGNFDMNLGLNCLNKYHASLRVFN